MTIKKTSFFNQLLINLIILISYLLNILDFKIKNIFILLNILVISFILMVYVKPVLDERFEISKKSDTPVLSIVDTLPAKIETLPINTIPEKKIAYTPLYTIAAKSFLIYDLKNNQEIESLNKIETFPPASLVKMLSIMYFIDKIELERKYDVFPECNSVEGQKVGYKKGEKVSGKDLINSSLVFSAGDSICNLYKITNSNLDDFNLFARNLGMNNSNFTNFIGLDYPGNYTTVEDLLVMAKKFILNDLFNEIVVQKSYKMDNGKVVYNTNKMLFENKFTVGIKTGTTFGAKENLIYRYKNEEEDRDILIIILNSNQRYQDIKNILNSIN